MGKFITSFEDHNAYQQATFNHTNTPNVGLCKSENEIYYQEFIPNLYNGHDYIEIGGLKWATMNIGANSIIDGGLFFQWGDTQGYTGEQVGSGEGQKYFGWEDYKYGNGTSEPKETDMTKYNASDNKTILELSDDAARVYWGGAWRIPTKDDFVALGDATIQTWTSDYKGSNITGLILTDKIDDSKVLFFPDAGIAHDGNNSSIGTYGGYWSSSLKTSWITNAYSIYFYRDQHYWQSADYRYYGFQIRPVIG